MVFWLPPRYHAGGPRWSKTAIRCKLPVLQHGHLDIKVFFSAFSNTFACSFSCKSFSFWCQYRTACLVLRGRAINDNRVLTISWPRKPENTPRQMLDWSWPLTTFAGSWIWLTAMNSNNTYKHWPYFFTLQPRILRVFTALFFGRQTKLLFVESCFFVV